MSPLSKYLSGLHCYLRGGSRLMLHSALATAVQSCREALMSCIMGVHRDGGMREEWGAETRSLPCAGLCFALLCFATQICGRRLMWSHLLHACIHPILLHEQKEDKLRTDRFSLSFLFCFTYGDCQFNLNKLAVQGCVLVRVHVWAQEEAWGRTQADSYGDLIPLDISWLGECGGTPCFMELAWII